jgi:hypothetical protein
MAAPLTKKDLTDALRPLTEKVGKLGSTVGKLGKDVRDLHRVVTKGIEPKLDAALELLKETPTRDEFSKLKNRVSELERRLGVETVEV